MMIIHQIAADALRDLVQCALATALLMAPDKVRARIGADSPRSPAAMSFIAKIVSEVAGLDVEREEIPDVVAYHVTEMLQLQKR